MSKEWRRKLDGTETQDANEYSASWMNVGNRICKALGPNWHVYAFDPDLCLTDNSGGESTILHKPVVSLLDELLTSKNSQGKVFKAVAARGYLDEDEWSTGQLIARQVVKLAEELGEAAEHIHGEEFSALHGLLTKIIKVGRIAKITFDQDPFDEVVIDKQELCDELVDIQIVVFVLATLLGIDSGEEALHKATKDVPRGVTC